MAGMGTVQVEIKSDKLVAELRSLVERLEAVADRLVPIMPQIKEAE